MTTNPNPAPQDQELRRVYTTSLAELFAQLNLSLVVSTYQAGKVILVRHGGGAAANGNGHAGVLNTRFPDILEWDDERLGTSYVLPDDALAETLLAEPAERR